MRRAACGVTVLLSIAIGPSGACSRSGRALPFGFASGTGRSHLELEARFLALPDAERIRADHRLLTSQPHVAGSARDRELADWTARQFTSAGLEDVTIATHDVMLSQPVDVSVEMIQPRRWKAPMRELPVPDDPDTAAAAAVIGVPFHAFSASGEIAAPAVYAGLGEAADYEWLSRQGVEVRGRIVVVRHGGPRRYRGAAAWTAQQHGAIGVVMYRDPTDDQTPNDARYPVERGQYESRIERGSIAFDFLAPGDPLTPGWPSVAGARRIDRSESVALPKIVSVPLSAADARPILEALAGPPVPERMRSSVVTNLRAGPGPAVVRLKVQLNDGVRPVWTVTGMLRGTSAPDDVVIVGNHRDAWIYGGVDPSTGSAAIVELTRAFGALVHGGWRPKRSVLFASWDAEELALTSSTEWGEEHEAWLRERAIAYLNVDSAGGGPRFVAGAVPSLMRVITEAASVVPDPETRITVAATERTRKADERGSAVRGTDDEVVEDRLGGGSDYAVFLNHIGVPGADLAFDGPSDVYHSVYDTHRFVSRVADQDFRYTTTLVKVLGVAVLRLVQADAIPLDVRATASSIGRYISDADPGLRSTTASALLRDAARELDRAAASFDAARDSAVMSGDATRLAELNRRAKVFERAFVDPAGLRGRPWYRHLVYAPDPSYAPVVLPGVAEAVAARDPGWVESEAERLADALRRAAAALVR